MENAINWEHLDASKEICTRKGQTVRLQYNARDPQGYCFRVNYAGNGHYFQSLPEAVAYMKKRKFLRSDETCVLFP